jgi:hypothetical protein
MQPDFLGLSKTEERLLVNKLDAVRLAIKHAGEKGRSLEAETIAFLRTFLPSEYGLSTGFVVFQSPNGPQLSSQLDIIIYDAIRSGPIARLTSCDVFPLEAVYGYVEVKASLRSCHTKKNKWPDDSIEKCLDNNKPLRLMLDRCFMIPGGTKTSAAQYTMPDPPSVRSYVLAYSAQGAVARDPEKLAQRMADYSALIQGVHLHGVFIAGSALYWTRPVDSTLENPYHIRYTTDHPLAAFKWNMLHDLGRYPRMPDNCVPSIDRYRPATTHKTCAPGKGR